MLIREAFNVDRINTYKEHQALMLTSRGWVSIEDAEVRDGKLTVWGGTKDGALHEFCESQLEFVEFYSEESKDVAQGESISTV